MFGLETLFAQEFGIFIVRILLGFTFFMHGAQKAFGWFGGQGYQAFVAWLMGMQVPLFIAYIAAGAEFFAALLLLFGIASEVGAALMVCQMIAAIYLVHLNNGYFGPNGFEYPLNLLILCFVIIIAGPGKYYLWNLY